MDKYGFFEYIVTYWEEAEHALITCHGLTYAHNEEEVIANLRAYYGDYLDDVRFHGVEPCSIYEFENNTSEKSCLFDLKVRDRW